MGKNRLVSTYNVVSRKSEDAKCALLPNLFRHSSKQPFDFAVIIRTATSNPVVRLTQDLSLRTVASTAIFFITLKFPQHTATVSTNVLVDLMLQHL